ncbi:hypothetical protein HPP92_021037 [Vanilla planifolia]|uniref:Uncharacterized protein n=1 Tax=Vanilla planifolia TaxID=51239 RepID=A0A835PY34_VANPL|nr:hypothetical protein HPP92_021037 [Vanilla planifolia]
MLDSPSCVGTVEQRAPTKSSLFLPLKEAPFVLFLELRRDYGIYSGNAFHSLQGIDARRDPGYPYAAAVELLRRDAYKR